MSFLRRFKYACAAGAIAVALTPVAIDATGSGTSNLATSLTKAAAIAANPGRCLYVFIFAYNGGTNSVSGVTHNGVAMTSIGANNASGGSGAYLTAWRLANPTSGTNNIIASFSDSLTLAGLTFISLYNVDQTTPENTVSLGSGLSNSCTGALGGLVLAVAAWADNNSSLEGISEGAGQTARVRVDATSGFTLSHEIGTKAGAAGTISVSYTMLDPTTVGTNPYTALCVRPG